MRLLLQLPCRAMNRLICLQELLDHKSQIMSHPPAPCDWAYIIERCLYLRGQGGVSNHLAVWIAMLCVQFSLGYFSLNPAPIMAESSQSPAPIMAEPVPHVAENSSCSSSKRRRVCSWRNRTPMYAAFMDFQQQSHVKDEE